MDRRVVEITLHGKTFVLRTDDEESFRLVVRSVNAKLAEIEASGNLPAHSVALLAALSFAEELAVERRTLDALREKVRARSHRLLGILEPQGATGEDVPGSSVRG